MKHILDATCGSRTIWFDKSNEETVYMDNRVEHQTAIWKSTKNDSVRYLNVEPDVIADFTNMPFADDSFELVVFDPPHLLKIGDNAWLKKKYGRLPEEWQPMIHDGFCECMRVLKPYGTMIFKWNEFDIPTRKIIECIGYTPLFGHRSGKKQKTQWLVFMKGVEAHERNIRFDDTRNRKTEQNQRSVLKADSNIGCKDFSFGTRKQGTEKR